MEFRDTGLPIDPVVYKAFLAYEKNYARLPATVQKMSGNLRIAQILNENTGNKTLTVFALLSGISDQGWSVADRVFGPEIAELKQEVTQLLKRNLAHVSRSSDEVKLFLMAADIVNMQKTIETVKSADTKNMMSDEGALPSMLSFIHPNDIKDFEILLKDVRGTTTCPPLEKIYQQHVNTLKELLPPHLQNMGGFTPLLEETRIADIGSVPMAYTLVTQSPFTHPEDLQFAIDVAELLSTAPAVKNPAAIAAALIEICFRNITAPELNELKEPLGQDVVNVLFSRDIPGYSQIAIASAIVMMERKIELIENGGGLDPRGLKHLKDMLHHYENELPRELKNAAPPELNTMFTGYLATLKKEIEKASPKTGTSQKKPPPQTGWGF